VGRVGRVRRRQAFNSRYSLSRAARTRFLVGFRLILQCEASFVYQCRRITMPTFILSLNWTDQGIRGVKDAPTSAARLRESLPKN
jgi:hypothetical protein